MDPQLVRPVVVPGTADPGGPWPWGGQVAPESRPFLVAAFNGGFQWQDFTVACSRSARRSATSSRGQASLIVYDDGSYTVGQWGRDTDPAKQVAAVRQNLQLLVDDGAPTPEHRNVGAWGGSVAGPATMRSAVGVDAQRRTAVGGRAAHARRSRQRARRRRRVCAAMEMDINPDWVQLQPYDVGADGSAHGNGLFGATGPNRYLAPDGRDFVAVVVRGHGGGRRVRRGGRSRPLSGRVTLSCGCRSAAGSGTGGRRKRPSHAAAASSSASAPAPADELHADRQSRRADEARHRDGGHAEQGPEPREPRVAGRAEPRGRLPVGREREHHVGVGTGRRRRRGDARPAVSTSS